MNTVSGVGEVLGWPVDAGGFWRVAPNGDEVALGNRCMLGDGVALGDQVRLGNLVNLGDGVRLGDWVTLGDRVKLGHGVTSAALNEAARQLYASMGPEHVFWKWVTPERMSPNFDGGTPLEYPVGAVVEAEGEISDQQCDHGLHVLRPGYRPEHVGLCGANHNLIMLRVLVRSEDILFAGLPTMDAKLRVRRLVVLD